MRILPAVLTCCLLSAVVGGSADQRTGGPADPSAPQPSFRTGIDLVHVDVSVLDKERQPVRGLTAADFTVREDGKVRQVVAFSAVNLLERPAPPPTAWMRDVPSDVVTNQMPRDGRLVVILLDRTIRQENMPWARRTAGAAVDRLGFGDLAAVIYTARGVPQNFTADRRLLLSAIEQPFLGLADDGSEGQRGECRCGVCTLEAMTVVADALREVPQRRKMLLFIGSTVPVQTTSVECGSSVREAREKLLRAAGVANLAIHTFDSTLLESLASTAEQKGVPSPNRTGVAMTHLERQGNLAVYADETGGRAIKNTNAPWEPIPAVFAETSSYYVLGFAPASARADGRYHGIKVDVNRRGVSVHPRQGYYGPSIETRTKPVKPGGPSPSLVSTLAGLWPQTQVPLGVSAVAFANPEKPEATVAVVLRAQEPLSTDGQPRGRAAQGRTTGSVQVNVLAGAYGRDGHAVDSHMQTLAVTPPPGAAAEFEFEVLSRLQLKPGRHEIRVAAEDTSRHLRGSVYTYVDVPDFSKAPLSLSGLVLGTAPAAPGGVLNDLLPLTPTAQRQFSSTRRVTAFLRVYLGGSSGALPVTVTARILDDRGRTSFEQITPITEMLGSVIRSAAYQLDLPLARLAPGEYLLTVEAKRGARTVRRDVRFIVR
jgi:VWFA-related protein